jgi:hypothetical protein
MISPELLRRYPFFSFLTPEQQRSIAMIGEETSVRRARLSSTAASRPTPSIC